MKTKLFNSAAIIVMAIIITMASCAKKGDTGPAGVNGKDGNSNVISSNTVQLNNWTSVYDDNTNFTYSAGITWATVTQAIVDKGVVNVYMQDGSGWTALPYSNYTYNHGLVQFSYTFSVGQINVYANGYGYPSPGAGYMNGDYYRVVAISASQIMQHPHVDMNNYEEVKNTFKIRD